MRKIEDWVTIEAETAEQAEKEAVGSPGVVHVFGRSAIMATPKGAEVQRIGVEDENG